MITWLDFGTANTGLAIGDLTLSARLLSDGSAADFSGATLSEDDATNLPGLYRLSAANITTEARGRAEITASGLWTPVHFVPSFTETYVERHYGYGSVIRVDDLLTMLAQWVPGQLFCTTDWVTFGDVTVTGSEDWPDGEKLNLYANDLVGIHAGDLNSDYYFGYIDNTGIHITETMPPPTGGRRSLYFNGGASAEDIPASVLVFTINSTGQHVVTVRTPKFVAGGAGADWYVDSDGALIGYEGGAMRPVDVGAGGSGGVSVADMIAGGIATEASVLGQFSVTQGIIQSPSVSVNSTLTVYEESCTTITFTLGTAWNLTGKEVWFVYKNQPTDSTAILSVEATITDAVNGVATYTPTTASFPNAGKYYYEVYVCTDDAQHSSPRTAVLGNLIVKKTVRPTS